MRVLVTGREGQLARSLAERSVDYPQLQLRFSARPELDLAVAGSAASLIMEFRPDLIVNAAAHTAVDRAEAEPDLAWRINAAAAGEIAVAAALGAPLIHISTDYLFDGSASAPMAETHPVAPLNVYGSSKAGGEQQVRAAMHDHLILRTAWIYSPFGRNFVKTMLDLAGRRDEIAVVADQRGCPTSALDLADLILTLASRRAAGDRRGWGATYHAAGRDPASWAELAEAVMTASAGLGGPTASIRSVDTADYPTPAPRPLTSLLDCSLLKASFGAELPGWREVLTPTVERLLRA